VTIVADEQGPARASGKLMQPNDDSGGRRDRDQSPGRAAFELDRPSRGVTIFFFDRPRPYFEPRGAGH